MKEKEVLLDARELKKYFCVKKSFREEKRRYLKAVDGISLRVYKGETLGLVGESGCGKSTLGRTILRLHDVTGGTVKYKGEDITTLKAQEMRPYRKRMQMIFQDPYASLNPKMTIRRAIEDPLLVYHETDAGKRKEKVESVMEYVGIPSHMADRYPHELSGGQRQRAVIARAMVLEPEFMVGDEPVSALDVSIRSQVLNLMKEIQEQMGMSYLFISHDLSVVRYLCDRVAVMYLGKIVEMGTKEEIFGHACHPYTQALLSAIPIPDVHAKQQENPACRRCPFTAPSSEGMPFLYQVPLCERDM